MINLAGVATCDKTIREELSEARIAAVPVDKTHLEVPYAVIGELLTPHGKFSFDRAWRYWMVKGNLPLTVRDSLIPLTIFSEVISCTNLYCSAKRSTHAFADEKIFGFT